MASQFPLTAGRPRPRNEYISLLRIVSAFGIVWFHIHAPFDFLGGTGLVVFLLITAAFAAGPDFERRRPVGIYLQRLILPWTFWFLVYAAMNILRGQPAVPVQGGPIAAVLAGPAPHLWYLPCVFAGLLVIEAGKRLPRRWAAMTAGGAAITLVLLMPWLVPALTGLGSPWGKWAYSIVLMLVGATLGMARYVPRVGPVLLVALAAAIAVTAVTFPIKEIVLVGVLGIGLVLAAEYLHRVMPLRISFELLARAMFGVYLIHPLVAVLAYRMASGRVEVALLTFSLSTLLVVAWGQLTAAARLRLAGAN